jgi:hypothetical protein
MNRLTVLNPKVFQEIQVVNGARRLADLKGAVIGFVNNGKLNADIFIGRLQPMLREDYGIKIGATVRKAAPKDELTERDVAELSRCEAVVQCYGDCGTSTSMSVADGVKLEQRGIPTVTVCSSAFSSAARLQAAGRGMADLPIVEIPHPMHTAPRPMVEQRADAVAEDIVDALTRPTKSGVNKQPEVLAEKLVLDDAAADLQEFFFEQGWTDGLPVVPPTAEKVEAMLAAAGRPRDEPIGPIPPRMRIATLEKIAINAVLAGCRPEYFPVVLAALEAALDDDVRLYGIQTATNTSSPLLIINGPVVKDLKLNACGNVFGQGFRANATIGRALQLILRNAGGDIPGETDMSTQGHAGKFTFCIAENEDENPWEPLHVERGFKREDSTVTVIGGSSPQNIFTYGCESGEEILAHFVGALTALGHNNIIFPTGPLFVLSPEHAHTLARDGYTKDRIKQHCFEKARIPLERFAKRTIAGLHHRRARWFAEVGDPRHIGIADRPADINIVVAGGAGIHSQFVPTSFSYAPVTRLIRPKK